MIASEEDIAKKYLSIIFIATITFFNQTLNAQKATQSEAFEIIKNNSFPFDPVNYADNFNFLKDIAAKKRIMILAEGDHGEGTSYLVISQMIKYLVDTLGFRVIVFENGNADVNYFQNRLIETDSIRKSETYLGSIFMDNKYGFDLIPFLQRRIKEKRIELFGIDFQTSLDSVISSLLKKTCRFFQCKGNVIDKNFISLLNDLPSFGYKAYFSDDNTQFIVEGIDSIIHSLKEIKNQNTRDVEIIIRQWMNVEYLVKWLNRRYSFSFVNEEKDVKVTTTYYAARDSAMAENLVWVLNYLYPNEKIIINVSAYHASKSCYKIEGFTECCKQYKVRTFGELLAETKFKDEIYSIAFVSSSGYKGFKSNELKKVPNPKKNSIEYLFSKSKFDFAFFDFNSNKQKCEWLSREFLMAPFFDRYYSGYWTDVFNGIIYIRDMKPNTYFR